MPDPKAEHAGDMAAIKVARAAIGDYKLRAAPESALANVWLCSLSGPCLHDRRICLTAVVLSTPVYNQSCLTQIEECMSVWES